MMTDMDGKTLKVGQRIVISWHGGSLMQATIRALEPYGRPTNRPVSGTLVLDIPGRAKPYRRRHYYSNQGLVIGN